MWQLVPHDDFQKRQKDFRKKYRREFKNALDNLDTLHKALKAGAKPQQVQRGFIRPEPHGVLAITESGPGKHLKATRLYVFPDESTRLLHVITIGDKASQLADIRTCNAFVDGLRQRKCEGEERGNQNE